MNVLVYVSPDGPAAVATLPDDPAARPSWYQPGELPSAHAHSTLLAKGRSLTWLAWAQSLAKSAAYGGSWQLLEVPDSYATRPDGMRLALAMAERRAGLFP